MPSPGEAPVRVLSGVPWATDQRWIDEPSAEATTSPSGRMARMLTSLSWAFAGTQGADTSSAAARAANKVAAATR